MKNSTSNHLIDEVNIVVYDKNTEHSNQLADQDTDAFAFILLTKIAHKFKSVSFLSGGFVDFHHNYPILCSITGPSTRHTSTAPTSPETTPSVSTEKLLTAMEPISAELNKRLKKHVLNHSISSYDTTSEFFRATSLNLAKSAYSTVLDTVPGHSSSEKEDSPAAFSTPSSPAIREPTKILNYLFLGSQEDALSSATLKALGITNVLNVSINCPKPDFISDANFLRISVNDGHTAKIRPFFDVAFRFIGKSAFKLLNFVWPGFSVFYIVAFQFRKVPQSEYQSAHPLSGRHIALAHTRHRLSHAKPKPLLWRRLQVSLLPYWPAHTSPVINSAFYLAKGLSRKSVQLYRLTSTS